MFCGTPCIYHIFQCQATIVRFSNDKDKMLVQSTRKIGWIVFWSFPSPPLFLNGPFLHFFFALLLDFQLFLRSQVRWSRYGWGYRYHHDHLTEEGQGNENLKIQRRFDRNTIRLVVDVADDVEGVVLLLQQARWVELVQVEEGDL